MSPTVSTAPPRDAPASFAGADEPEGASGVVGQEEALCRVIEVEFDEAVRRRQEETVRLKEDLRAPWPFR
jgi:hypothetical protein